MDQDEADRVWRERVMMHGARVEAKIDGVRELLETHVDTVNSVIERVTFVERNYVSRAAFWGTVMAFLTFFAGTYATMAGWLHR